MRTLYAAEVANQFQAGYEACKRLWEFILLKADSRCTYLYVVDIGDATVIHNNNERFRIVDKQTEHFTATRFEVDLTIPEVLDALGKMFGLVEHHLADNKREQVSSRILKIPRRRKS